MSGTQDVPFTIGETVALICDRSIRYTVKSVQENVDTGWSTPHISGNGKIQHYYTLINKTGGEAFWWHSQLTKAG